jgi:hypothetical protein
MSVYSGWKGWLFMFFVAHPLNLSSVATAPYRRTLLSVECLSTSIALADTSHITTALAPYIATPPRYRDILAGRRQNDQLMVSVNP